MTTPRRRLLPLFCALLLPSCGKDVMEPDPDPDPVQTGSIQVTTATTGANLDDDGYSVSVGTGELAIAVSGTVTFSGVAVGAQSVGLDGVADNCEAAEPNPQAVTVVANQTASVSFTLTCSRLEEEMWLLAADRDGTLYLLDEETAETTRLGVPFERDVDGEGHALGVISSMSWLWTADAWWLGLGGDRDVCGGCVFAMEPSDGLSSMVGDPSATIRAPAGMAVHPLTGDVYTTEGDGSDDLYLFDIETGDVSVALANIGDPGSGKGMTFSNDGLLYIGGSDELVTVDLDGGGSTHLGVPALTGFPPGVTRSLIRSMATRESDGTIFAITRRSRSDPAELATVNPTTGELTHIGTSPESLDGLAFIRARLAERLVPDTSRRIVFASDRTGDNEIYSMGPWGGDLIRVTNDDADDDDPSFSPDRSQIAFASDRDGNYELYVAAADGSGIPTRLTNTPEGEWDATYSPDGSRILFLRTETGTANHDLYSMAADGSDVVRLTDSPEWDANPDWSPDGSQMVYISRQDGDWEIYTTDATQLGTPVRLTQDQGVNADPDWSPDGSRILFKSDRTGQFEIWSMNPDGTDQVQLTTNGGEEPNWSPDGSQIVFTRGRDGGRDGDWEIYVMNADGTGIRPISNMISDEEEPDWR